MDPDAAAAAEPSANVATEEELLAKKQRVLELMDSLHSQIHEQDMEENGLAHLDIDGAKGADGGVTPSRMKLDPTDVGRLEHQIRMYTRRREELVASKDWRGLRLNEKHYTRSLELLLANQQTQLDSQRDYVSKLRENLQGIKDDDRCAFQAAISESLQTPMQSAANSIIQLISNVSSDDAVAIPLATVLKQISAANLYQPTFDFESAVDSDTQKWISATFAGKKSKSRIDQRRGGVVSFGSVGTMFGDLANSAASPPRSACRDSGTLVRDPPPHGLSYHTTALIITDCNAMRSLRTKWP